MLFEMTPKLLEPIPYKDIATLGKLEKDLENLIAGNLLSVLFEDNPFLPIFQERSFREEPDIIAMDKGGNIVIIEIKRSKVGSEALTQVFRYAQQIQSWTYETIQDRLRRYLSDDKLDLKMYHRDTFGLPSSLDENHFNRSQRMLIVGNSLDIELINYVEYWRTKGIDIDFIPYRIYELGPKTYLEFFAKPYDVHSNRADIKGVIFDSNRAYDEGALEYMFKRSRVSSFGERADAVYCLHSRDYVFLSHKYVGIVAAAQVVSNVKTGAYDDDDDESYVDVRYLTPIPEKIDDSMPRMSFSRLSEILDKPFYWARIDKRPYLSKEESEKVIAKLREEVFPSKPKD